MYSICIIYTVKFPQQQQQVTIKAKAKHAAVNANPLSEMNKAEEILCKSIGRKSLLMINKVVALAF